MNAENFAVNDCTKHKEIKDLAAGFPNRGVSVLRLTFFVETVDLSDLPRFVITTDESDAIRVPMMTSEYGFSAESDDTHLALRQRSRVKVSKLK